MIITLPLLDLWAWSYEGQESALEVESADAFPSTRLADMSLRNFDLNKHGICCVKLSTFAFQIYTCLAGIMSCLRSSTMHLAVAY